jgi:hypothetical protein
VIAYYADRRYLMLYTLKEPAIQKALAGARVLVWDAPTWLALPPDRVPAIEARVAADFSAAAQVRNGSSGRYDLRTQTMIEFSEFQNNSSLTRTARALFKRRSFARSVALTTKLPDGGLLGAARGLLQINRGDAVGIIGSNGSGKSTVLKLISRIIYPTSGVVTTRGRVAALLELGAGFHPDLTGRENIDLNGAILGLRRQEVRRQANDIIAFSELERFIDVPIRNYSSGMMMRLGLRRRHGLSARDPAHRRSACCRGPGFPGPVHAPHS